MFKDKKQILNFKLIEIIGKIGHFETIVICDAGYPVNNQKKEILDLSLVSGKPSFLEVFNSVTESMCVQKVICASEMKIANNKILTQIQKVISVDFVSHEELKQLGQEAILLVRTGETTPYANAILVGGVNF